jgi:hypothetical protein
MGGKSKIPCSLDQQMTGKNGCAQQILQQMISRCKRWDPHGLILFAPFANDWKRNRN